MKTSNRLTAFAASAVMTLSLIPPTAAFAADESGSKWKGYTGTFNSSVGEYTYYYSDSFFEGSGRSQDPHLRTMSMNVAMAAFGDEKDYNDQNIYKLLTEIGFPEDDYESYDYNQTPAEDSIACVIASKDVEDENVVLIAVRGANYLNEWASNLTAGSGGDAKGFAASAGKVISRLEKYLTDHPSAGEQKFWITGYSRGGAVADLVGKYLNENLDKFGITGDDIFAYTFEAPRASSTETKYENIHNVRNPYDLIPMVYPESWGLYNAGVEDILAAPEKPVLQPKQLGFTGVMQLSIIDKESEDPVPMDTFEDQFIEFLSAHLSRENFSSIDPYISRIVLKLLNTPSDQIKALGDLLVKNLKDALMANIFDILGAYTPEQISAAATQLANAVIEKLENLDETDKAALMTYLTPEEYDLVKTALDPILQQLLPIVVMETRNPKGLLYNICTFAGNLKDIIAQHYPQLVYQLVIAGDPFTADPPDIARGKAVYFGNEADEEQVYDDEYLRSVGFVDEDIAWLSRGFDVTYGFDIDVYKNVMTYSMLPEDDIVRKAVDSFAGDRTIVDALPIYVEAKRIRGFTESEKINAADHIAGGQLEDNQIDLFTKNQTAIIAIDEETGEYKELKVELKTEGDKVFLQFKPENNSLLAVMVLSEKAPEPAPEKKDDDTPPNTGAALPVIVMLAASALVFTAARKRK